MGIFFPFLNSVAFRYHKAVFSALTLSVPGGPKSHTAFVTPGTPLTQVSLGSENFRSGLKPWGVAIQHHLPYKAFQDISWHAHLPGPHQFALPSELLSFSLSKGMCKWDRLKYNELNIHTLLALVMLSPGIRNSFI